MKKHQESFDEEFIDDCCRKATVRTGRFLIVQLGGPDNAVKEVARVMHEILPVLFQGYAEDRKIFGKMNRKGTKHCSVCEASFEFNNGERIPVIIMREEFDVRIGLRSDFERTGDDETIRKLID